MSIINKDKEVVIIGGGLAGIEVANILAQHKIKSRIFEARPIVTGEAHLTDKLGELVCSNSLKSESLDTAAGLLKIQMKKYNSLVCKAADYSRVPAGSALAVDRDLFSDFIEKYVDENPFIQIERKHISEVPLDNDSITVVASGPLTSKPLSESIQKLCNSELYFYDAISPIIDADSIDYSVVYFKSRYDKGDADYLNIPLTQEQYKVFYENLMGSEKTELHDFEKFNVYEGCMPIEELAKRGEKTLLFGPMRPVGLALNRENPPAAVIQLRKENKAGTAYNIVGFQTKMKIKEQKRVFQALPGLENAEFLRYGSLHRNTYINSPKFLDSSFKYNLKEDSNLFFAGQITGVEGYMESSASGIIAGLQISQMILGLPPIDFSKYTAFGAITRYISGEISTEKKYTPSNFHFGMLPPLEKRIRDKKLKKLALSERASLYI